MADVKQSPLVGYSVCFVCPCYNEQEVIIQFMDELRAQVDALSGIRCRFVLVDDGSSDTTLDVLNRLAANDDRIQVYSLSRNFGHQTALSAGLEVADGDAVVMMDTDLQHPPSLVAEMIARWNQGFDVIQAQREDTEGVGVLKKVSSGGFYWMFNWLSDTPIVPGAADFCLLSRRAHQAIKQMPERHRFLRGMIAWIGFPRCVLPYTAAARAAGHSKYNLSRMLRLAFDAIFSFSTRPLRIATRLGLLAVAAAGGYLFYAVAVSIFSDEMLVKGWLSLLCTILLMGGLQLIFVGTVGEYVARVLEEVKGRPLYLFKQVPPPRVTMNGTIQHGEQK
jgi:dolichol-phosphate mannosyltransferase